MSISFLKKKTPEKNKSADLSTKKSTKKTTNKAKLLLKPKLSKLSKRKNKTYFSLDIGSSSIKVLQLSPITEQIGDNKYTSWKIDHIGISSINKSVILDKSITDSDKLSNIIKSTLKRSKIKTQHVFASIPSDQATSKLIHIPSNMSTLEEEDFVQLEISNYIPFPPEEINYDYEIHGVNKKDPSINDVLLVAVKKDQYQNRVDPLFECNLKVDVMDVEEYAVRRTMNFLINRFPLNPNKKNNTLDNKNSQQNQKLNRLYQLQKKTEKKPIEALFDIGHDFSFLYVLQEGNIIYCKEQNFGMSQLMEEAKRKYEIDLEEIKKKILSHEMPKSFYIDMLPEFKMEILNHLNRLIQFFFSSTSFHQIDRIWLAGGGANLSGIKDDINTSTGIKTEIANPLKYLKKSSDISEEYIHNFGTSFVTAFGLATRIYDESLEF